MTIWRLLTDINKVMKIFRISMFLIMGANIVHAIDNASDTWGRTISPQYSNDVCADDSDTCGAPKKESFFFGGIFNADEASLKKEKSVIKTSVKIDKKAAAQNKAEAGVKNDLKPVETRVVFYSNKLFGIVLIALFGFMFIHVYRKRRKK